MGLQDNKQTEKNRNFFQSLRHALDGVRLLISEERNFRFDLIISIIVVILGLIVKLNLNEWLWLCVAFFTVLSSEALNSIVENVVDLIVDHRFNLLAKRAKDIAAGAVLLSAFFAIIVGCLIFIPKIINLI